MTENAKTIAFVVVGLVAIAIGVLTQPSSAELDEQSLVGQDLTKDFDSPDEAKRLKIVRFDEDTATLRDFEVAERDGLWTIPSKDGYPADAARQMAEAATSLMDRKILFVASMSAGDHEEFGVIDPLSPKLEVGQKGVGTHVTMYDVHDAPLTDLIVGKPVKDAEGQRYVREAGRDIVYVIEIDPAKLSTNFEDWIEKDLLKLNSWDLQQVQVKDYSAELQPVMTQQGLRFQLAGDMRSDLTLAYNDSDAKWNAGTLRQFDTATEDYVDFTLAEDEELNTETLNALKTALDDLQIVDVVRKPQGLSDDLKAGEDFMKNEEALRSLVEKGFTPTQSSSGSGAGEIISSDGEVIATMKNGTEYVLRFGNLTNVGAGDKSAKQPSESETPADDAEAKDSDVHRYLFVMARFNENAVKKPELEKLPELPAGAAETTGDKDAAASTETAPADGVEAEKKDEAAVIDEKAADAPAETSPADTDAADASTEVDSATASASEATSTAESSEKAAENADTPESGSTAENQAKTAESTPPAEGEAKPSESDKTKELEALVAERKRIEDENKRKEDEHKQNLEKGRESVKDLNLRFGDWYFVVADDVFKKIRLSRENVIKKKEKKDETDASKSTVDPAATPSLPDGAIPGLPPIPTTTQ